jgi:hypothetical protein
MRKFILVVLVVILVLAMAVPAIAHPSGQGKGCGCHRVADKMTGSIHTGYAMSGGKSGGAAACLKCH